MLRDWAIGEDGRLRPLPHRRSGARRHLRHRPELQRRDRTLTIAVPAAADVRLRILNIDRTRIMQLGIEGAECAIVAIDGNAGFAVSAEGLVRRPGHAPRRRRCAARPRAAATLVDYFAPEPVPLAHFRSDGRADAHAMPSSPGAAEAQSLSPSRTSQAPNARPIAFSATATGAPVTAEAPAAQSVPAIFLDDLCTNAADVLGHQQAGLAGP